MTNYYYIDISLVFPYSSDLEITPVYFKKSVMDAGYQLFGQTFTSVDVDLLKYNEKEKRAVLRVPQSHYVKLRSSLSFVHTYADEKCYFRVHKASPLLLSLQGDSRSCGF
uniref:Ribonuclease P protein subunit p14 n=1 Tax=Diabrotica virgifera virgifera TaxID=50390 RepID=A0A6P7GNE1_DIAVI